MRQDGRTIRIGQNVRLLERDGAFAGFQAVARDISERREIDRMKDEFIGLLSHELRSPLTSVLGSLELVASGRLGDEQQSRMISIAADNARRLLRPVNDFLDLERLNSGEITPNRQETDILHSWHSPPTPSTPAPPTPASRSNRTPSPHPSAPTPTAASGCWSTC